MKEIKEKPTERAPKSDSAGKIPKAALKKAWTETKEKSRAKLRESTSAQGDGDYTTANDTGGMVTDTSHSAIQQNTDFTVQQSRKFARKQIEKYRERHTAEQVETSRAYTAGERGVGPKQARRGTLPDAEPRPHRGADLPHQRAKEKVDTAKTAPRDIRGVTQGQRQLRTAANETVRNVTTQAQVQTRTRQVQLAMQKAAANTRKTATAVRSAIRHFLASLRSLVTAIVTGISVALSIIIVISLVAFVSGSAYGIFFAANAPNENAISVQEALETLTGEYRDRLEEISNTIQHDRQDIVANDGVHFIRWQDVLAVFSSYVSGDEFGSSVASLERRSDRERQGLRSRPRDRVGIELKDRVPDQEPNDPVADEFVVFVVVATPVDRVPRLWVSVTRVAADEGNPHRVAHGVFDFGLGERVGPVGETGDFDTARAPRLVVTTHDCGVAALHEAVRHLCHSSTSPSHRRQ